MIDAGSIGGLFGRSKDSDDPPSISRYLGNSFGVSGDNDASRFSFSDILSTQMTQMSLITKDVSSILERLKSGLPLVSYHPDQVSEKIMNALKSHLHGVNELYRNMGLPSSSETGSLTDMDGLIDGLKHLYDQYQNPLALEHLSEVWKKLKKKDSPLFHSVHAYFLHIAVSYQASEPTQDQIMSGSSKQSYSDDTYSLLLSIIQEFDDSQEKEALLSALTTSSQASLGLSDDISPLVVESSDHDT